MPYPMWDKIKRGIIIDRGNGITAYIENGDEFDALKVVAEDWHEYHVSKREITPQEVNQERDRRLSADFEFQGKMYQRDRISLQRITGAATLAGFAIGQGAQVGDYKWADPNNDFGWIASDNTVTLMDAQTCFTFGQAAANVETRLIFKAAALRSMNPIPEDYTDDKWWT